MSNLQEVKEEFGKMVRWTEAPKDQAQAEKTVYIGPVLHGIYVGKKDHVGTNDSNVYDIKVADGTVYSMWGSDLLDGKFNKIFFNSEVRVTCLGIAQPKTPKGRAYMNFKVEAAKPVTTMAEVAAVAPESPSSFTPPAASTVTGAPVTAPTAPVASDEGY